MSIEWITILLFASMFVFMATGLPVAWVLGGVGVAFAFFLWGIEGTQMALFGIRTVMSFYGLLCAPLFIFMGMVLSQSGIIDKFFTAMINWFGFLPGSLASTTIGVCAAMAAMVGEITPATLTMGTVALPAMLKKGYDKSLAIGCIQAGAALGFLIPPSIIAILYGVLAKQSIGQLFAGGLIPGVMLSIMYIIYITVRCSFQPWLAPRMSSEKRPGWGEKVASLRAVVLPTAIILAVLGSIFFGIATPVEASGVGATASILAVVITRSFNWQNLKTALSYTLRLTSIACWIFVAAIAFSKVYQALGASQLIENMLLARAQLGPLGILILMQLSYFLLGMILDDTAILFICLPLYIPIAKSLGFDPIWFGVLYIINMQMAFLTPPFGYCLFLMKSVCPPDITMGDVYNSVWPFVAIQAVGLIICIAFPDVVLWLPKVVFLR